MATVKTVLEHKGAAVAWIHHDESALAAAQAMNERRIGALVVVERNRVVGIVTERDIMRRLVAVERDPAHTRVAEIMSTPVAVCRPETDLEECRAVMTDRRIRHLPVVEEGRLTGIITSGDILAREVDDHVTTIMYLYEYLYSPGAPIGMAS